LFPEYEQRTLYGAFVATLAMLLRLKIVVLLLLLFIIIITYVHTLKTQVKELHNVAVA